MTFTVQLQNRKAVPQEGDRVYGRNSYGTITKVGGDHYVDVKFVAGGDWIVMLQSTLKLVKYTTATAGGRNEWVGR